MIKVSDDPREAAQSALDYEAEGYRILREAGEQATDPLSRATFEFLAEQELVHMEAIKAYSAGGGFDAGTLPETSLSEAGREIGGLFARFKGEFDEAATAATRLDVYDIAEEMERRGYEFYQAAAAVSTDENARRLYTWLAEEETRHFKIVQDTHDYLKQPDAFQAVEERWMQI